MKAGHIAVEGELTTINQPTRQVKHGASRVGVTYEKWVREYAAYGWRQTLGWRRFLILDWWKFKLNIGN